MTSALSPSVALKLDLIFEGIRFTEPLWRASESAFPNFFRHRFAPGEDDPTGTGEASVPYMLVTHDDVHVRIRVDRSSSFSVSGSGSEGYRLDRDGGSSTPVSFEPLPHWMTGTTRDGLPRARAGISLHADMAVVNVAPGCEYFRVREHGTPSMRCTFCTYGAPDVRVGELGQVMGRTELPEQTYTRLHETLTAALDETPIRHIYLVGGSLLDPREEGRRFIELARRVQAVNKGRVPVTCGSGALPSEALRVLHGEGLVDAVSFNLEVWSEALFARVCPGKHRYVGYDRWLGALEEAAALWGAGRAYSAMVAGLELLPEYGMSPDAALALALEGAEQLCARGVLPIYSLYWPPPGLDFPERIRALRDWFQQLQLGYSEIRRKAGLSIWDGFMCHRCAFMQVEADFDRVLAEGAA